ncbi:hypothetical protein BC830DRAFT_1144019, partial [Chytriomyces sp. MP71]
MAPSQSSSNSTANNANDILSRINFWEPVVQTGINAIAIPSLIAFLLIVEAPRLYPSKPRWKVLFSRSNQLLVGMWLFGAGYNLAMVFYNGGDEVALTAATVLMAGLETCYVWFSWLRATVILGFHAPPRIYQFFKNLTYFLPFTGIFPVILALLPFHKDPFTAVLIYMFSMGIGGVVTCCVDIFFLYSYTCHARQYATEGRAVVLTNSSHNESGDVELRIISTYGFSASLFALGVLGCYLGAVVCRLLQPGEMEGSVLTTYYLFWILKDVMEFGSASALAAMKVSLILAKSPAVPGEEKGSLSGPKSGVVRHSNARVTIVSEVNTNHSLLNNDLNASKQV